MTYFLYSCGAEGIVKIGPDEIIIQEDEKKKEETKKEEQVDSKESQQVITRKDTASGVRRKIEELRELLDSFTVRGDRIQYEEMNVRDSIFFSLFDMIEAEEQPTDIKIIKILMSKLDSLDNVYIKLSKEIPEKEFRIYDDSLYTRHKSFLKKIKKEKKERISGFRSWEKGTAHLRQKD